MRLKITKQVLKCSDCNSEHTIIEDPVGGNFVCKNCGCVVEEGIIAEGKEWRVMDDDSKNPSRVGALANPFIDSNPLDTIISGSSHTFLTRTHTKNLVRQKEQNLRSAYGTIQNFCDRNNFSKNIMDRAKICYQKAYEKEALRGKGIIPAVAACLYLACRLENCPRTFKEISIKTGVSRKEIGKCFKVILPHIEKVKTIRSEDIVSRFCSELKLDTEKQKWAIEICKNVREKNLMVGRSPDSLAAGIIFLVTQIFGINNKQSSIAKIAKVTDGTVKHIFKELEPYFKEIVPTELMSRLNALDTEII